jgi:hypothetical protein
LPFEHQSFLLEFPFFFELRPQEFLIIVGLRRGRSWAFDIIDRLDLP